MGSEQPGYPVNMTDHDLLIRVDQKLTQLSLDVSKSNDGLTQRLAVVEAKVIIYDQVLAEYSPTKLVPMLYSHEKWITEFRLTWRVTLMLAIGIGSFITFVLTTLLTVFHIVQFAIPK